MASNLELSRLFFKELKRYNTTNFKTLARADLSKYDATTHKAFSSVVTRYFIFSENHPEISEADKRMLFFKLKIDMVSKYFSLFPDVNTELLRPFQLELLEYIEDSKQLEKPEENQELVGGVAT